LGSAPPCDRRSRYNMGKKEARFESLVRRVAVKGRFFVNNMYQNPQMNLYISEKCCLPHPVEPAGSTTGAE